ncbi:hypothetical protein PanWU01x14_356730 [Parasponia andersonii]|uniref:Uncharacterized protein n=1 Tax=Parasponia andersonii TaxID=3476 RepID=A0A2P5A8U2_PARAD|nr:hypothetical protein PanWU01x14_356730 [Parasponia andersonii]
MSSSKETKEGNTFSRESSFSTVSISSIDLNDYLEQEPEIIEIMGTRKNNPHIRDLPEDQRPQHVRDVLEYSFGHQYVEGDSSCDNIKSNYIWAKVEKLKKQYNYNPKLKILTPTEFNHPNTPLLKYA